MRVTWYVVKGRRAFEISLTEKERLTLREYFGRRGMEEGGDFLRGMLIRDGAENWYSEAVTEGERDNYTFFDSLNLSHHQVGTLWEWQYSQESHYGDISIFRILWPDVGHGRMCHPASESPEAVTAFLGRVYGYLLSQGLKKEEYSIEFSVKRKMAKEGIPA